MENGTAEVNQEEKQTAEATTSFNRESQLVGISIRGWLATLVTITVCIMSYLQIKIEEPFYGISLWVLGFYFGQKTK